MKIAFCFAGQGSQYVGMGLDFYNYLEEAKETYDKFPEIRDLCFYDKSNVLNQTAYAQKAMLLTGFIIANALKKKGIVPTYACGLSLGEYSALTFANTWTLEDAIDIISYRGRIMQDALPLGTTKMAAVLGMERAAILETLKSVSGICEIANYNCPGQIVISGEIESVDMAMELLIANGAKRCIPLNVSGAFHSSLLVPASNDLKEKLDSVKYNKPEYKIVYNVSGKEETRDINDILQDQICHSVYFEDSINYLIDKGVDTFIEIGPGKTLSGFIKKISKDVNVYSITDIESFNMVGGLLDESCDCNRSI